MLETLCESAELTVHYKLNIEVYDTEAAPHEMSRQLKYFSYF